MGKVFNATLEYRLDGETQLPNVEYIVKPQDNGNWLTLGEIQVDSENEAWEHFRMVFPKQTAKQTCRLTLTYIRRKPREAQYFVVDYDTRTRWALCDREEADAMITLLVNCEGRYVRKVRVNPGEPVTA